MIYLDNAATTGVHPDVLAAMMPYFSEEYGNPSSVHQFGRRTRRAVDAARRQVAEWIGGHESEVVFTSGGTESIHSALFGAYLANPQRKHIVTTGVEHHAVLHTCAFLQQLGVEITVVAPQADGRVQVEDVLQAIRSNTCCVSVMTVNNELGTILPVDDIARAVKAVDAEIMVHSDMVQVLGSLRIDLKETPVDFASFAAHKVHGPKGVGALFLRKNSAWKPVLRGGTQERDRRAGTENVAGIVGFGAAVARLSKHWEEHQAHLHRLRDAFWHGIQNIADVRQNTPEHAVPTILNVAFAGIRNDTLLARLDLQGIAASAGSACTAGSLEPSHVLTACGQTKAEVLESIRFSFSDLNTLDEVVRASHVVCDLVTQLRGGK